MISVLGCRIAEIISDVRVKADAVAHIVGNAGAHRQHFFQRDIPAARVFGIILVERIVKAQLALVTQKQDARRAELFGNRRNGKQIVGRDRIAAVIVEQSVGSLAQHHAVFADADNAGKVILLHFLFQKFLPFTGGIRRCLMLPCRRCFNTISRGRHRAGRRFGIRG